MHIAIGNTLVNMDAVKMISMTEDGLCVRFTDRSRMCYKGGGYEALMRIAKAVGAELEIEAEEKELEVEE
mgnify:CR=1 FL=1